MPRVAGRFFCSLAKCVARQGQRCCRRRTRSARARTDLPRRCAVAPREVACEVAWIAEADARHDLLDGQRGLLHELTRSIESDLADVASRRASDFGSEQVR